MRHVILAVRFETVRGEQTFLRESEKPGLATIGGNTSLFREVERTSSCGYVREHQEAIERDWKRDDAVNDKTARED